MVSGLNSCNLQILAVVGEKLLQFLLNLLSAWFAVDVVQLVRVALDIIQLPVVDVGIIGEVIDRLEGIEAVVLSSAWLTLVFVFYHSSLATLAVEVNQLVTLGAHTVVLAYQVVGRVIIIMIVQALAPLLDRCSGKQRLE